MGSVALLQGSAAFSQIANAQLGIALPLAYGYNRVRGNNVLLQQLTDKSTVAFYIYGEGEWDGLERLWLNRKLANIADTTVVHFHPGIDGVLGRGLNPTSVGGDQGVDQFFSLLPSNFQRVTFSRKAYLAVHVQPDPAAPSATLDVVADCRCCKVRQFDVNGNQTAYGFSTNGAWQVLDLILRTVLKPDWLPSAAAAAGGDLTADEKARIDFTSLLDSVAWCDFNIGNGIKRFESSVAFPSSVKLQQALAQLLTMSQLFVHEAAGRIFIRADKPRVSTFILTADHIVPGTGNFDKIDLHGTTNRIIASYNDLNPMDQADIDTTANNGLVRNAGVVTVKTKGQHPFLQNDNVQILNCDDPSFTGVFTLSSVPTSISFTFAQPGANATSGNGYCGMPESRFIGRSTTVDHEKHQNAIGQRGLRLNAAFRRVPLNITLGNNTSERTFRILNFLKIRNLGVDASPYNAPWTAQFTIYWDAVDSQGRSFAEQLLGDVLTIDRSISEEFAGDYEILDATINHPSSSSSGGSGGGSNSGSSSINVATVEVKLLQFIPSAFSDVSVGNAPLASSIVRGDLPLSLPTDNLIRNGDFEQGMGNWQSLIPNLGFQIRHGIPGLPRGSSELMVNPTSQGFQFQGVELIPVDINKVYLMECWLRIVAPLTGGIRFFCGLQEYDLNKNQVFHFPGNAFAMWCSFVLAASTVGNTWQFSSVEISGSSTSPSTTQFNAAAAYVSAAIFLSGDAAGVGQQVEMCGFRLSEVAAGSRRAITGLNGVGQIINTFKSNPVNSNGAPTGPNPLTQVGTSTAIAVASNAIQFGAGVVAYNSGSLNPGSYGTFAVYAIDPTYAGGSQPFFATPSNQVLSSNDGIVPMGVITTVSSGGGAGTGGGTGAAGGGSVSRTLLR
ncbi:MAG TPA: hypothetical protein VKZ53_13150 [Candidatus Angelobacter sp.]|nr:hypothetical protein [Candidatus Angelobacter sp.]